MGGKEAEAARHGVPVTFFSLPMFFALFIAGGLLGSFFPSDSRDSLVYTFVFWGFLLCHAAIGLLRWTKRNFWWEPGAGRCRSCGYDLTGNTSGTCPECGTPTPVGSSA